MDRPVTQEEKQLTNEHVEKLRSVFTNNQETPSSSRAPPPPDGCGVRRCRAARARRRERQAGVPWLRCPPPRSCAATRSPRQGLSHPHRAAAPLECHRCGDNVPFLSRNARKSPDKRPANTPRPWTGRLSQPFQLIMFEDQSDNTRGPSVVSKSGWLPEPMGESSRQR